MIEQAGEGPLTEEITISLSRVKGIAAHSRFMLRKPTWIGFRASPLGDVLASN
jgi:hypothetical protein